MQERKKKKFRPERFKGTPLLWKRIKEKYRWFLAWHYLVFVPSIALLSATYLNEKVRNEFKPQNAIIALGVSFTGSILGLSQVLWRFVFIWRSYSKRLSKVEMALWYVLWFGGVCIGSIIFVTDIIGGMTYVMPGVMVCSTLGLIGLRTFKLAESKAIDAGKVFLALIMYNITVLIPVGLTTVNRVKYFLRLII